MKLPTEDSERQKIQLDTWFHEYFFDAQLQLAKHSYDSNAKHNGINAPMSWDKNKSVGNFDRIARHRRDFKDCHDAGDKEGAIRELSAHAWRSLELLQRYINNLEPFDNESIMQELSDIGQAIEAEKPTEDDEVLCVENYKSWANSKNWWSYTTTDSELWWHNGPLRECVDDEKMRELYVEYCAKRDNANNRTEANQ